MRVLITPEAQLELREATDWYAERSPKAAAGFVVAYKHAKSQIADLPRTWPEVEPGVRRVRFRRYPFSLLYSLESNHALVLTVAHDHREPGYWHGR
jgi:plasmid stabilization system protein ParE